MQPAASSDRDFKSLLSGAVDLLKAHPLALLAPLLLLGLLGSGSAGSGGPDAFDGGSDFTPAMWVFLLPLIGFFALLFVVVVVIMLLLHALATGVTAQGAFTALQGGQPDLAAAFAVVRPRFTSLFLTFLLFVLAVVVGFILLVVPGFVVAAVLAPWPAVLLREQRTGIDALKRAFAITEGDRMTLFLLVAAGFGISFVADLILGFIPLIGGALAGLVGGAVTAAYVVLGVVYYDRKVGAAVPAVPAVPTPA